MYRKFVLLFLMVAISPVNTMELETKLHVAAQEDRLDLAQEGLEEGEDINAQDDLGWTPLHYASKLGTPTMVQFLLENEANVAISDNQGNAPIHEALIGYHRHEVVNLLVQHGANVNAQGRYGWTPLHYVANEHSRIRDMNRKMAQFLIDCGASIHQIDDEGRTPYDIACGGLLSSSKEEIKDLLKIPE